MNDHKTIVVIANKDTWEQALANGTFVQSTLDQTLAEVGFIHCSFPFQTMEIVNRKFSDRDDLVLLIIDASRVKPEVKYEGALSGRPGTFPHIYGPLNVDAVVRVIPLEKDSSGTFTQPEESFFNALFLAPNNLSVHMTDKEAEEFLE